MIDSKTYNEVFSAIGRLTFRTKMEDVNNTYYEKPFTIKQSIKRKPNKKIK